MNKKLLSESECRKEDYNFKDKIKLYCVRPIRSCAILPRKFQFVLSEVLGEHKGLDTKSLSIILIK